MQAARLLMLENGGAFEFHGAYLKGIEGYLATLDGRRIPVSLKSFDDAGSPKAIARMIKKNAEKIEEEGISGATLYAEPTQFTVGQLQADRLRPNNQVSVIMSRSPRVIERIIFKAANGILDVNS